MSVTSVRLSNEIEEPLEALCAKLDRSKSYLINQAVKEFIIRQSMEESRWIETIPALESVRSDDLFTANEVENWLQSWGSSSEQDAPDR